MILNPFRWWRLQKKRAEFVALQLRYREMATRPGETTVFDADAMWGMSNRMHVLRLEIRMLEGDFMKGKK